MAIDEIIIGVLVLVVLAYLVYISWCTIKEYISDDGDY